MVITNTETTEVATRLERMERAIARLLACLDRDDYLTEREAAALRRKTVYALRKERARRAGPPYLKDGACVRYSRTALLAWIEAHTRDTHDSQREPRFPLTSGDAGTGD